MNTDTTPNTTAPQRYFRSTVRPPRVRSKTAVAEGIRRDDSSGSLEVRVRAGGRLHQRIFPSGTPLETAVAWRTETRAAHGPAPRSLKAWERPLSPAIDGWCYIYFIRSGNAVKVGRATNVLQRLRELQTAAPHRLELLVAVAGHAKLEAEFHQRLEPTRLNGEWFIYGPQIQSVVRALQGGENPVELLFGWDSRVPPQRSSP